MNISTSNSEKTNLEHNIEILNELIEEEIHWFIKLIIFFKMLKIC